MESVCVQVWEAMFVIIEMQEENSEKCQIQDVYFVQSTVQNLKKNIQFEVKFNSKEMQILMFLKMQILHRVLLCKLLNFPISIDF